MFTNALRCVALHRIGDGVAHAFKMQLLTVYVDDSTIEAEDTDTDEVRAVNPTPDDLPYIVYLMMYSNLKANPF